MRVFQLLLELLKFFGLLGLAFCQGARKDVEFSSLKSSLVLTTDLLPWTWTPAPVWWLILLQKTPSDPAGS